MIITEAMNGARVRLRNQGKGTIVDTNFATGTCYRVRVLVDGEDYPRLYSGLGFLLCNNVIHDLDIIEVEGKYE